MSPGWRMRRVKQGAAASGRLRPPDQAGIPRRSDHLRRRAARLPRAGRRPRARLFMQRRAPALQGKRDLHERRPRAAVRRVGAHAVGRFEGGVDVGLVPPRPALPVSRRQRRSRLGQGHGSGCPGGYQCSGQTLWRLPTAGDAEAEAYRARHPHGGAFRAADRGADTLAVIQGHLRWLTPALARLPPRVDQSWTEVQPHTSRHRHPSKCGSDGALPTGFI